MTIVIKKKYDKKSLIIIKFFQKFLYSQIKYFLYEYIKF